jgi:hypothetical protein
MPLEALTACLLLELDCLHRCWIFDQRHTAAQPAGQSSKRRDEDSGS